MEEIRVYGNIPPAIAAWQEAKLLFGVDFYYSCYYYYYYYYYYYVALAPCDHLIAYLV
jgi:hypothetical protein